MSNSNIGVKDWRSYSGFALFANDSQRADRNSSLLVDHFSGNFSLVATDWNLAGRIPCSLARAYNHLDSTTGVDRPFGPGWYWQFDMNITGDMTGNLPVTWKAADGSEYDFTFPTGSGTKTYSSPVGLQDYTLQINFAGLYFQLLVGTITYKFSINLSAGRARLVSILDAFGNGLIITRNTDSHGNVLDTISKINQQYYNGSAWVTHDIVEPTYGTYNSENRITKLRLLDTVDLSGHYIEINYAYSASNIDGWQRLEVVTPKRDTTNLDLEVAYSYNNITSGLGLQLEKVYDTAGYKALTQYAWSVNYSSGKVSSIVFPIDSGTSGTTSFAYAQSAPSGWPTAPSGSTWTHTVITDAENKDWHLSLLNNGTVPGNDGRPTVTADPLWTSSNLDQLEYSWNGDNQITQFTTPKPNGESGQLTTHFHYNSDRHLAAVVDPYGFVSWFVYGSRASYGASGSGATIYDVIGIFTPLPGQQAYDDSDHTISETVAPTLTGPVNPASYVSWDTTNHHWKYTDGSGTPKTIQLVRTVIDYTFTANSGKLTQVLSCSPSNFTELSPTTYTLSASSGCTKLTFDTTTGDLTKSYTPRQYLNSSLYWTEYNYDQISGVITSIKAPDAVAASASNVTTFDYDATKTILTKLTLPQSTGQWTQLNYNDAQFLLQVQRPDIGSWSVDPIVATVTYDYNGNIDEVHQADPTSTSPSRWNGTTGYNLVIKNVTVDRINRPVEQERYVQLDHSTTSTLTSKLYYTKTSRLIVARGPAYAGTSGTLYTYLYTKYDDAGRPINACDPVADSSGTISSLPGTLPDNTAFTYDLAGNVITVTDQLALDTDLTYDWRGQLILTSRLLTGSTYQEYSQHFDASRLLYWSLDPEGKLKTIPHFDISSRVAFIEQWWGASFTSHKQDLRIYDANSNLVEYYGFQDVASATNVKSVFVYDLMDRLIQDGRSNVSSVIINTSDRTYDYNSALLRTFDKVNSGKYIEREYDDWGQLTFLYSPEVPDPSGTGTIIYNNEFHYDVLGRLTDHYHNDGPSNPDSHTVLSYDWFGRVIQKSVYADVSTSYDTVTFYDERGKTARVEQANGSIINFTYDDKIRIWHVAVSHDTGPVIDTTTYTYYANSNLAEIDHPDGGVTQFTYDNLNRRQTSSVLLSGSTYVTTTYTYDLDNRMLQVDYPRAYSGSYTVHYDYDDVGTLHEYTDTNGDLYGYTWDEDGRMLTSTLPSGLVTTWSYTDWVTRRVSSVNYHWNGTTGDDISLDYTYDYNGQLTQVEDDYSASWYRYYDAMWRLIQTDKDGHSPSYYLTYDGRGNTIKSVDFNGTTHYYQYDWLNRMTGHGATSSANDETYAWDVGRELTGYTDAIGTGSIDYDELSRIKSHTDSNGNTVQYEYDAMDRCTKIIPAQGNSYRTEYAYNKNGSLDSVTIYDGGTGATTTYEYLPDGKLEAVNLPAVSGTWLRTNYTYDSAGRIATEFLTHETTSSTPFKQTTYDYSYISTTGGRRLVKTEQHRVGSSWVNDCKVQYDDDSLERHIYEERNDWVSSTWSLRYQVSQDYDKVSNRIHKTKTVVTGYENDYGKSVELTYGYDSQYKLTGITDGLDAHYSCTITCDDNANVLGVDETDTVNHGEVWQCFTYDDLNRMVAWNTVTSTSGAQVQVEARTHAYDALARLLNSTYSKTLESSNPCTSSMRVAQPESEAATVVDPQHTYSSSGRFLQNTDGTNWGEFWRWAHGRHSEPFYSPAPDSGTASYNIAQSGGAENPTRWMYADSTATPEERLFWQQGQPQAKDSTASGADWAYGIEGVSGTVIGAGVNSRAFYEGTVAPTDMDEATDPRQNGYIGIFGTNLDYAGAGPHVRNDELGASLNPAGGQTDIAYLPGTEPPGWNDQLTRPLIAYLPGQEPPGWNDQLFKPMNCVGPNDPDPWADMPQWGMRPMNCVGPGEADPYANWDPLQPRPMGAGTGEAPAAIAAPAPAKAYLPGCEPPGWNEGRWQLTGASPSACAAVPPGGWDSIKHEQLMPATPHVGASEDAINNAYGNLYAYEIGMILGAAAQYGGIQAAIAAKQGHPWGITQTQASYVIAMQIDPHGQGAKDLMWEMQAESRLDTNGGPAVGEKEAAERRRKKLQARIDRYNKLVGNYNKMYGGGGGFWGAVNTVLSGSFGRACGIGGFIVATVIAGLLGAGLVTALAIGFVVGLASKVAGGVYDAVAYQGGLSNAIDQTYGPLVTWGLWAGELAWTSIGTLAVGLYSGEIPLYRLSGEFELGGSYSLFSPALYGEEAVEKFGLPPQNSADLFTKVWFKGAIWNKMQFRFALPIGGNLGGAPEFYLPYGDKPWEYAWDFVNQLERRPW